MYINADCDTIRVPRYIFLACVILEERRYFVLNLIGYDGYLLLYT